MNFQKSTNGDKFNTKLFVHIFPTEKYDWDCLKVDIDKRVLYVRHAFEFHSSLSIEPLPKFWCFKTNGIFMNSCQNEIYSSVTSHIFGQIFHGIDQTVMSYGQNYSGKTFTMSGFYNQYELRGIVPRFVVDLFKELEVKLEDYTPKVYLSVVDVNNHFVYDLLSPTKGVCKELKNVREMEVLSGLECLELLFKAESQRILVKNKSYNSHFGTNVVTLKVKLISSNRNEPLDKVSKVNFVDLAGVETIFRNPITSFKDQYNQGKANVTKSLLELYALRSKNKENQNVYRNTTQNIHVLTKYLGKSFSSAACISLICHIRPNHEDIKITLSTLKFGRIFQGIPLAKPEEHKVTNYEMTIEKLQEEIKILKDELLMLNLKGIKSPIKMSQDRIDFAKRTVLSFLNGEFSDDELLSLIEDPNLILNLTKSIHNQPIERSSVSLQTELQLLLENSETSKKSTVIHEHPEKSSIKRMSGKISLKEKPGKVKETAKSKTTENVAVQSENTQVNLLEPNVTLPNFDSKESLWAMFLISKPDIHDLLEKLNSGVAEKNRKVNYESSIYDDITQSITKRQLVLNQLVTYRHTDSKKTYDKEGKVIVPQEEEDLIHELKQLQRDLDKSKQRLIDAQFDWLEALEKFSKERGIIEKDFKQFCIENNCVAIEGHISGENIAVRQNQSMSSEDTTVIDLKKIYQAFQKKHLHKVAL